MARHNYFARGSVYSEWNRYCGENIAMIDIDSMPICYRKGCWMPLAVVETVFDTGNYKKYTSVTQYIAKKLGIRAYLLFYKPIPDDTKVCNMKHNHINYDPSVHDISFKVQRLVPTMSELTPMSQQEWLDNLVALQLEHDWDVGHIWKPGEDGKFVGYGKKQDNKDSKGNLIKK